MLVLQAAEHDPLSTFFAKPGAAKEFAAAVSGVFRARHTYDVHEMQQFDCVAFVLDSADHPLDEGPQQPLPDAQVGELLLDSSPITSTIPKGCLNLGASRHHEQWWVEGWLGNVQYGGLQSQGTMRVPWVWELPVQAPAGMQAGREGEPLGL